MAKKKVVVKVCTNNRNQEFSLFPNFRRQYNRVKALQIATAVLDVIEVMGDGVDAVELTRKLCKSLGYANLEMVNEVKEEEKQEENKPKLVGLSGCIRRIQYML
ncbi:hypothetical protein ACJRO7_000520 [Eucalyptus globulus]|uniref:Uncharacterized protein n=1 Tax=Eucalyptus globulus TaxID=34317 RepID=A0ABD3LRH8_EUCGL